MVEKKILTNEGRELGFVFVGKTLVYSFVNSSNWEKMFDYRFVCPEVTSMSSGGYVATGFEVKF